MILGILSRDVPESKAREAFDRLRAAVVDFNELRVIPPIELAEMLGDYPDARLKCEDISRSLNKVFALTHAVSLDHLAEMPRKEARAFLENVDGLEAYTRARVQLLGLGQHAIPLDEAMWAYARQEEIVDRRCPLEEAQAFLERHVGEDEALEFVGLLKRQAWNDLGVAVRRREVEPIRSVPPDRSSRNMLQMIGAASADVEEAAEESTSDEVDDGSEDVQAAGSVKATRTPATGGSRVMQKGRTRRSERGSAGSRCREVGARPERGGKKPATTAKGRLARARTIARRPQARRHSRR